MMTKNNILQTFSHERQHSENTKQNYARSLHLFEKQKGERIGVTFNKIDRDIKNGVRFEDSMIKQDLINFRNFLFENYRESTAKAYFNAFKTILRHFNYQTDPLPFFKPKHSPHPTIPPMYSDLPTKDMIRDSLNYSNDMMKALILFIASSGCGRTECYNLTVRDFIQATADYHSGGSVKDVLKQLDGRDDIIPMWRIHRQKTNKYYFTFNTPEATKFIVDYLYLRKDLTYDSKLFKFAYVYLSELFINLNKKLHLEKNGLTYNRFRPHTLRKYHASQLYNNTDFKKEEIDSMQGRSKDKITNSYFFENPLKLKEKYINGIDALTIFDDFNNIKKLQEEVQVYQKQFVKQQKTIDDMKEVLDGLKKSITLE